MGFAELAEELRGKCATKQSWLATQKVIRGPLRNYFRASEYVDGPNKTSSECVRSNWAVAQDWYGAGPAYVPALTDDDGSGVADDANSTECRKILDGTSTRLGVNKFRGPGLWHCN